MRVDASPSRKDEEILGFYTQDELDALNGCNRETPNKRHKARVSFNPRPTMIPQPQSEKNQPTDVSDLPTQGVTEDTDGDEAMRVTNKELQEEVDETKRLLANVMAAQEQINLQHAAALHEIQSKHAKEIDETKTEMEASTAIDASDGDHLHRRQVKEAQDVQHAAELSELQRLLSATQAFAAAEIRTSAQTIAALQHQLEDMTEASKLEVVSVIKSKPKEAFSKIQAQQLTIAQQARSIKALEKQVGSLQEQAETDVMDQEIMQQSIDHYEDLIGRLEAGEAYNSRHDHITTPAWHDEPDEDDEEDFLAHLGAGLDDDDDESIGAAILTAMTPTVYDDDEAMVSDDDYGEGASINSASSNLVLASLARAMDTIETPTNSIFFIDDDDGDDNTAADY